MATDYKPFDGDGRMKVEPINPPPDTRPIAVRKGTARMAIDAFLRTGNSTHSAMGMTLWVILAYCDHHQLAYTVEGDHVHGYNVSLIKTR